MDVKNIASDVDLRLNLLSGESLFSDNIEVKPFTLREINKIGFSEYMRNLNTLVLDKKAIFGEDAPDKSIFEVVLSSDNEFLTNTFLNCLSLFLHEDRNNVVINNQLGFIFNGKSLNPKESRIINQDSYDDILQILKYQNGIIDSSEVYSKPNPVSDKTRQIQERLKKANEKIVEAKQKESQSNIDFADIVSAVSSKSNTYNKHNVWDLTIYQLYDEYKRLEAISSYDINIMAMLQGAKIDDLKHWSAKIQN